MNVSYSWLKDYVPTKLEPRKLAERIRLTSSEVEGITDWGKRLEGLVVGEVLTVSDHPDAHSLHLATVTIGSGRPLDIVCGAPNLAVGQRVVVALPGVTITDTKGESLTLAERTIRGQRSQGMLCAAEEFGLPLPSDGIMVLPEDTLAGTPAATALGLGDQVFDVEITPNRPDLLSYVGLAREVATFDKKSLQEPPLAVLENDPDTPNAILVHNTDSRLCARYSAVGCSVSLAPSPLWMQVRLLVSGIRPINNVVDITNYVMLELGEPLHAFDWDTLPHKDASTQIEVRSAKRGEKMALLDGTERELATGDIVICDGKNRPIALGGIMGGEMAEISATTTRVILEAATFHGPNIRRTSRRLGLRSEASTRFEKGLDPELTVKALKRALYLLEKYADAKLLTPLTDAFPRKAAERPRIHVTHDQVRQVLGTHISVAETKYILQKLGFQLPHLTKSSFEAVPPTWRADVKIAEDVIEELVRLWGFERLPETIPSGPVKPPYPNTRFSRKAKARHALASLGLQETITLSFVSKGTLERSAIPLENTIALPNPLSEEQGFLKPNHLASFLPLVNQQSLGTSAYGYFEIGKVFLPPSQETEFLGIVMSGKDGADELYRDIKTKLNRLADVLHLGPFTYTQIAEGPSYYLPGSILQVLVGKTVLGTIGLIGRPVLQNWKIRGKLPHMYAELDIELLFEMPQRHLSYQEASAYPSIERDLTLIVDAGLPIATVEAALEPLIRQESIVADWYVDTVYSKPPVPEGKKAVTLHFTYNNPARTLRDEEVSTHQEQLVSEARSSLQALTQ